MNNNANQYETVNFNLDFQENDVFRNWNGVQKSSPHFSALTHYNFTISSPLARSVCSGFTQASQPGLSPGLTFQSRTFEP